MKSNANQITQNTIYLLRLHGCKVERKNTMGVFDLDTALKKIHAIGSIRFYPILDDFVKQNPDLKKALQKSYRKSHEELGSSDIHGMTKQGFFVAGEVKGVGDTLSVLQQNYLLEVYRKNGIPFVVCQSFKHLKFEAKVFGFEKIPIIEYSEKAVQEFAIKINQ